MAQYSDWEDQGYDRQLSLAQALRKKGLDTTGEMRGRIYVPKNPWVNFAEGAVGGILDQNAQEGQRGLQGRRQAEVTDFMGRRPDTMMDQTVPGTPAVTQEFPGADAFGGEGSAPVTAEVTPEVLPMTKRVMKPYEQQIQETQKWMGDAPAHMGDAPRAAVLAQALASPQKMRELDDAQEARKFEILSKAAEARKTKEEADARAKEAKREADERHATLEKTLKAMGLNKPPAIQFIQTVDEKGNPVIKGVPKVGGAVHPSQPSAAERKDKKAGKDLAGEVDYAISIVDDNADAFGIKTFVPDFILDPLSKDGEVKVRAVVGALKSAKIKDMSGTAVSAHEQERLNEFLPAKGDQPRVVKIKLQNYKDELARKGYIIDSPTSGGFEVIGERDG